MATAARIPIRTKQPARPQSQVDGLKGGRVYLHEIRVGQMFLLSDDTRVIGEVLHHGVGSVTVKYSKGDRTATFTDKAGAKVSVSMTVAPVETWSPNTIVTAIKADDGERRPLSLRASAQQSELEAYYEEARTMAAKKEAKKGKIRSKAEKSAGNSCGCGCGKMVTRSFAQGHDSKFYSQLKKVAKGESKFGDLPAVVQKAVGGTIEGAKAAIRAHEK